MILFNRGENESSQDFVNRLCVENAFPAGTWPKPYKCRFIEPGLVNYADYGTILVQKAALDKMAKSFIGKPVVNEVHRDVTPADFNEGEADGIVTDVWYDPDGWYWANFLVWDPATQKNCDSAARNSDKAPYSVSCAYDLTEAKDEGGTHNNIVYNQEVVNGEYTHLAIVANPRYEGARILYNSKGGTNKMWKFWQSNGKEKVELQNINEDSTVEVDGKEVSLKQLVEVYNADPAKSIQTKVVMNSIVDVDGKEISVSDLVARYKAKNAEDDKDKEKKEKDERENAAKMECENAHKAGTHTNRLENCSLCNAEEKKEKDDKDEKEKRENALKNEQHFVDLRNAAQVRGVPQAPKLITKNERIAEGAKRYGSAKSEAK